MAIKLKIDWYWGLGLVLAVIAVYAPIWRAGYVWDDSPVMYENPVIVGPYGLKEIWTTRAGDICPLTLSTFWLEYKWWGANPLPYHLVNVFLHALNAVVLWRVLLSLRVAGAWFGAALWALHPVMVESVAWVSELKNAESGLFFLLAILFFVKLLRPEKKRGGWSYGLALFFSALAVASKSSTVILPLVFCLCGWWMERSWNWRTVMKTVPVFAMAIAAGLFSIWTQDLWTVTDTRSWPERLMNAGGAVCFYVGKLIWPHPLLTLYPPLGLDPGRWWSYLPLLGIPMAAGILYAVKKPWSRGLLFAFGYFLVALGPVLGLINSLFFRFSLVADHFQYLASMGLLAAAGAGLVKLGRATLPVGSWSSPGRACLLLLGILTLQQAALYQTEEKLWAHTLRWNPNCAVAYSSLAYSASQQGRPAQAMDYYQRALALEPDIAVAQDNLGVLYSQAGRTDEAIARTRKAIEIAPGFLEAYGNLAVLLVQKGQLDEAIACNLKAIEIDPHFAGAHYNLGIALEGKGRMDDALAEFQRAVELKAEYPEAWYALGGALYRKGQVDEAIVSFQKAVEFKPDYVEARNNLGAALAQAGRLDEALVQFEDVLRRNPASVEAQNNIARLRAKMEKK